MTGPSKGGEVAELLALPTMRVWPDMCRILGVSKDVGYRFVREGGVRSLRIGKRIVVPTAAVKELLGITQ